MAEDQPSRQMSAQAQELLQQAIAAIQQGDRRSAVRFLAHLLEQEPRNAAAWYWLSKTQDDPLRKRECLVRALRFQPDHAQARAEFEALERQTRLQIKATQPLGVPPHSPLTAGPSSSVAVQANPNRAPSTWLWLSLMGLLMLSVLCLGGLFLTASFWQPLWERWVSDLDWSRFSWDRTERLPQGLSIGYWMFEVQQPLPPGIYIGDLVLLPDQVFWFGYFRGKYRIKDERTLTMCGEARKEGVSGSCFELHVSHSQSDQVIVDLQVNTSGGKQWVKGLLYRRIIGDKRAADLASDLVGRWQSFPLDYQTRIAQGRGNAASPDEVYLFTASGELWAGGRRISSYRIEDGMVRVPEYFGDFGERFQVDRLGDWMVLVGQINQPPMILSLRRLP
jgi:hypothetical protein